MGYSEQYKGYKCLYPPTKHVYISRHVSFYESQFPFKDLNSLHADKSSAIVIEYSLWFTSLGKHPIFSILPMDYTHYSLSSLLP